MSRLLFWLRRFRLSAQGWRLQRLVRMCLIAPSISFAEVRTPPSRLPAEGSVEMFTLLCISKFLAPWPWRKVDKLQAPPRVGQVLAKAMQTADVHVQIIASELSRVMLIAIEVAVEYWLALTWSPQAQWLSEVSKSGIIQDEVSIKHVCMNDSTNRIPAWGALTYAPTDLHPHDMPCGNQLAANARHSPDIIRAGESRE